MKSLMPKLLCVTLLLGGPVAASMAAGTPMDASQRSSLIARQSPRLESMRAGAPALRPTLDVGARTALRQAESRSRDLATLRAGALTDREWTLVVVAVAIIIIVVAIA